MQRMPDLNVARRLFSIVERLFAPAGLKLSATTRLYADMQLDQSRLRELVMECEDGFDCEIPDLWLSVWATLGGVIETIERLKSP